MRFSAPIFLVLLLLLPLTFYLSWGSGGTRVRRALSLFLRSVILLCLIFALAGLELVRGGDSLAVVFLLDVSDSMPDDAILAGQAYIREALQAMGADDQAALVVFGADALVERPMSGGKDLPALSSAPVSNQTDLAEAIQLGLALFPAGYARRMVILSDGAETTGDALAAARYAAASGAQIVVVPFVSEVSAEALISKVEAPAHLRSGENFTLDISVQATQPMRAVLRVLAGDRVVYQATHELRKGLQTFSLPLTAQETGFVSYQAQIIPEGWRDAYYQNNRLHAFSQVEGPPRALLIAPPAGETLPDGETRPDEAALLVQALSAADYEIDLRAPALLPSDLTSLAQYAVVVLADVPARDLTQSQMEALRSYVRDLGGGLVAIGGPTSYGVGGYYNTPLEDALPVNMQIKDQLRRPQLTMVFIIDHSGSMGETSGGATKLELAKEAAARSVELLFPADRVGVIAFDDTASWVVPITPLQDSQSVVNKIAGIQVGGGTDIYAGLLAMSKVLPQDPAKVKHVILLTDGGADPAGIPELVKKLYEENGVTLSTVGVGNDAAPFLKDLAELGGGRYHFTNDPVSIPSIFTEETTLASRSYIVEETFYPALVNSSPILANIYGLPPLRGYVATSAKDFARVILQSPKGDPILATWQYGLGRAAAFTSDASGRWAADWARSEIFPTFWAQALGFALNDSPGGALQTTVETRGEIARMLLDARELGGAFLNGYQIEANVVPPRGETQTIVFTQTAPGRYESEFKPQEQGVYLFRFSGKKDGAEDSAPIAGTTGWVLSYSPEYARLQPDPDLLLRLAELADGQVASPVPADAFKHDLPSSARAAQPFAPVLLLLAALLFPLDVAARRVIVTRSDWERAVELLTRALPRRKAEASALPADSRLTALKQAKNRARSQEPPRAETLDLPAAAEWTEEKGGRAQTTPPAEEKTSTASALLARKNERKKK